MWLKDSSVIHSGAISIPTEGESRSGSFIVKEIRFQTCMREEVQLTMAILAKAGAGMFPLEFFFYNSFHLSGLT